MHVDFFMKSKLHQFFLENDYSVEFSFQHFSGIVEKLWEVFLQASSQLINANTYVIATQLQATGAGV